MTDIRRGGPRGAQRNTGRLRALLTAGAVLVGLGAAPPPGIAGSPAYPRQDTPTFPPAIQTLMAGGASSASASGVVFTLSYQLTFNDGSPLNGQLTDRVTGQYALSCGDVGSNGHRSLVALDNDFLVPGGVNIDPEAPVNVGLAAVQYAGPGTYHGTDQLNYGWVSAKPPASAGAIANVPGLTGVAALQTFKFDDDANAGAQLTVNADGSGSFTFPNIRPDQYTPKLVPDGFTLAGTLTWTCS